MLLAMARSLLSSMDKVLDSLPQDNPVWHFSSFRQYAEQYNDLALKAVQLIPQAGDLLGVYDIDSLPHYGNTIHMQQHAFFQDVHGRLSMLCALIDSEVQPHSSTIESQNLQSFLSAAIRPAVGKSEPMSEKEVQSAVEVLLIGRGLRKGLDYDRETGRVKTSGKESIPDFIFRPMSTALEVKLINSTVDRSHAVDEINADILTYSTVYAHLIFLVYDIGQISDEEEFVRDFESTGNVKVLIIKH